MLCNVYNFVNGETAKGISMTEYKGEIWWGHLVWMYSD